MKYLKKLAIAALAAMALTALVAASASATTIEVGGSAKNEAVKISSSPLSGTSAVMGRTDGSLVNTCTGGSGEGTTQTPFTGSTVTGTVTSVGTGPTCTRPITVHKFGNGHIQWTAGTNGTVSSSGAEVTVGSPFGTLNCKTITGTHMGTLTGSASSHATLDVSAVINCGFLVPSATLKGTAVVTSPTGLGVVS